MNSCHRVHPGIGANRQCRPSTGGTQSIAAQAYFGHLLEELPELTAIPFAGTALHVAGTDTDIGKTFIACRLLEEARLRGQSTLGLKPLASGKTNGENEDVRLLREASTIQLPYRDHNPICLDERIAPHIAAENAGVNIDFDALISDVKTQLNQADFTVVEGCGGWLAPINAQYTMGDFAAALDLPVLLVVGMKLGCLNHALLSVQAIEKSGCRLAGWIANLVSGEFPYWKENIESLERRIDAPLMFVQERF